MISITYTKQVLAGAILTLLVVAPVFAFAAPTQETIDHKTGITYECVNGDCTFDDLLTATKNVTDFGRNIALEFSVVVIAIAGFKYMTSGDNPGERKKANQMFVSVAYGIFFVLAAWLIVHLITNALLSADALKLVPVQ